jgi:hypothetical protein
MTWYQHVANLTSIFMLIIQLVMWVNRKLIEWAEVGGTEMPRATVNIEDTKRVELKTAPPDGYVVLRRMSYGQIIQRREMATQMRVTSGSSNGKRGGGFEGEMNMINERVQRYEFQKCIIDHNLEDEKGRKLNFENPSDFTILDPRVGQEIEHHISQMNNFDEDSDTSETGDDGAGQGN